MILRRLAVAAAAIPVVAGGAFVAAHALPPETACRATPDGSYTLCLLMPSDVEGQNFYERRNELVMLFANDDPETEQTEDGLFLSVYQYELSYADAEEPTAWGTGFEANLDGAFDHDRLVDLRGEHGGNTWAGDAQTTDLSGTVYNQSGHYNRVRVSLENAEFFGGEYDYFAVGVDQNDDTWGFERFTGLEVHRAPEDSSCALMFREVPLLDCLVHRVPPNPPTIPFLPLP